MNKVALQLGAWACLLVGVAAHAQETNYYQTPAQIRGLDVDEQIGKTLPMDAAFTNEEGKSVTLRDYFTNTNKPAVLTLVYYDCPLVCDLILTKQAAVFAKMADERQYLPGKQFRSLVFSFDPREKTEKAAAAKETYLAGYPRRDEPGVREGWRFHTGTESASRELADALGFQYRKLSDGNYSHPICQFIITPDGRVSRYLYGYPDDSLDLTMAIIEASEGKVRKTIGERFLSFCYEFDASIGKYTLHAVRIMQVGGAVTLLIVGTGIALLIRGEKARRRAAHASPNAGVPQAATTG